MVSQTSHQSSPDPSGRPPSPSPGFYTTLPTINIYLSCYPSSNTVNIHHAPSTILHSPFSILHSPFSILHSQLSILHSPNNPLTPNTDSSSSPPCNTTTSHTYIHTPSPIPLPR